MRHGEVRGCCRASLTCVLLTKAQQDPWTCRPVSSAACQSLESSLSAQAAAPAPRCSLHRGPPKSPAVKGNNVTTASAFILQDSVIGTILIKDDFKLSAEFKWRRREKVFVASGSRRSSGPRGGRVVDP